MELTDFEKADYLKHALICFATNDVYDIDDYNKFRKYFLNKAIYLPFLPAILKRYLDARQIFKHYQEKSDTYKGRREIISKEFEPLLNFIDGKEPNPADELLKYNIDNLGEGYITEEWNKALKRRTIDPKGAITISRTLLETTCKFILDRQEVNYDEKADLPELYKLTSQKLNLAPSQHTEDIVRQILGGCHSIVVGMGTLRNRISDAHGQGVDKVNPHERHVTLAVNIAGALATFLLQTWKAVEVKEI